MNTFTKAVVVMGGALLLTVAVRPGYAQVGGDATPAAAAPSAPAPAPVAAPAPDTTPAAVPAIAPAPPSAVAEPVRTGGKKIEQDLDLYWGEKRRVSVVERAMYPKDSRHELSAFGGIIPNDPFLFYYAAGGRYGYFFTESFSLEATYSKLFLSNSNLGQFLQDNFSKIDEVQENDRLQQMAHLDMAFTPFYGKMAFLSTKLCHFDLGLRVGAGWLNTAYTYQGTEDRTRNIIEGNAGAGFRFHLGDYVTLRFDVDQYFFKKVQGGLSHPTMISLGLSTMVPYPVRSR